MLNLKEKGQNLTSSLLIIISFFIVSSPLNGSAQNTVYKKRGDPYMSPEFLKRLPSGDGYYCHRRSLDPSRQPYRRPCTRLG